MLKTFFTTAALVAAASLHSAEAHSMMTVPKPNSNINNSPSGTIDGPSALPGGSYGTSPDANTASFLTQFKAQSKYKSIRDIVYAGFKPDGASTKECGQSAATGPAQPLPDFVEYGGGFDSSHEGPCEVWCDDVRVFYEDNCSKKYTAKPAKLPYDKSKCAGAKRLQSIWLALHVPAWQAYISCATLSGAGAGGGAAPAPAPAGGNGGGNGGGNASPAPGNSTPTVKPSTPSAPSPAAPAPAPATGGDADDCDEDLPEPDCDDDLPEPAAGDADCDEDLPEPDCDDDLPEPKDSEYGGEADVPKSNIGFGAIQRKGGESAPGKVSAKEY